MSDPSTLCLIVHTHSYQLSELTRITSKANILPVIVFKIVDALPFDGLLQDLRLTAAKLLAHLHQPGREG